MHVLDTEKRYYLRLDISDFFDTINEDIIKKVFEYYFRIKDEDINNKVLNDFINIITLNGTLPQGAVTSPVVSNIVFRSLDIRIERYCAKLGIMYSRYADDMLFSSYEPKIHKRFFIGGIGNILKSLGFRINFNKVSRGIGEISLNGFVVGDRIRLSRKRKTDISKILFLFEKQKKYSNINHLLMLLNNQTYYYRKKVKEYYFPNGYSLIHYLCGYRSFLLQWLPPIEKKEDYQKAKKTVDRLEKMILYVTRLC